MRRGSIQSSTRAVGKGPSTAPEEDRFNMIKTPLKKVSILFDRIRTHGKVMFNYHRSMKVNHKLSLLMDNVGRYRALLNCLNFCE